MVLKQLHCLSTAAGSPNWGDAMETKRVGALFGLVNSAIHVAAVTVDQLKIVGTTGVGNRAIINCTAVSCYTYTHTLHTLTHPYPPSTHKHSPHTHTSIPTLHTLTLSTHSHIRPFTRTLAYRHPPSSSYRVVTCSRHARTSPELSRCPSARGLY